jgi:hypothetical protein
MRQIICRRFFSQNFIPKETIFEVVPLWKQNGQFDPVEMAISNPGHADDPLRGSVSSNCVICPRQAATCRAVFVDLGMGQKAKPPMLFPCDLGGMTCLAGYVAFDPCPI